MSVEMHLQECIFHVTKAPPELNKTKQNNKKTKAANCEREIMSPTRKEGLEEVVR
jgi:hypothetical protein